MIVLDLAIAQVHVDDVERIRVETIARRFAATFRESVSIYYLSSVRRRGPPALHGIFAAVPRSRASWRSRGLS